MTILGAIQNMHPREPFLARGISHKKTVHVSVGSGGRLRRGELLISLHNRLTGFPGSEVILSNPGPGSLVAEANLSKALLFLLSIVSNVRVAARVCKLPGKRVWIVRR